MRRNAAMTTTATLDTILDPPERISQPAAARKLGVSLNSVTRLGTKGEIRLFNIGHRKFVDAASLTAYIRRLHGESASAGERVV
jgi:hypothetical protein